MTIPDILFDMYIESLEGRDYLSLILARVDRFIRKDFDEYENSNDA